MKLLRRAARALAPRSSLALPSRASRDYYTATGDDLHGAADPEVRRAGLNALLPYVRGQTILDLGCAEGFNLRYLLRGAPAAAQGIDNSPHRIASAQRLGAEPNLRFDVVELNVPANLAKKPFAPAYDIVLCLGLYQHLLPARRREVLRLALAKCRHLFAFRCPARDATEARIVVESAGFRLEQSVSGPVLEPLLVFKAPATAT